MKKLFLLVVCCLVLFTGCGKKEENKDDWRKNFQASKFQWEGSEDYIEAVDTIKNTSGKKCNSIEIKLIYKKEDFEREETCWQWPDFEDGESFEAECFYNDDSKDTIKNYSITVDNIRCRDEDLE